MLGGYCLIGITLGGGGHRLIGIMLGGENRLIGIMFGGASFDRHHVWGGGSFDRHHLHRNLWGSVVIIISSSSSVWLYGTSCFHRPWASNG